MSKNLIMTISIILKSQDNQLRIGGGIDPELSLIDFSWTNFQNSEIWLENNEGQKKEILFIQKVEIFPATADRKNIGLTISNLSGEIEEGDKVFKYTFD